MTLRTILVYEDIESEALKMIEALRSSASSATTDATNEVKVKCVWFKTQALPDHTAWPRRMPLRPTEAIIFDTDGTRSVLKQPWWQGDFDGAVIDVWDLSTNEPKGETYLKWLSFADFDGPVSIVSSKNVPAARRSSLASSLAFKKDEDDAWCRTAATHVLHDWAFRSPMVPIVGSRGLNPLDSGVLARFIKSAPKATQFCRVLWAGADKTAQLQVSAFIPNLEWSRAEAGFCWRPDIPLLYLAQARDDGCTFVCVDLGTETANDTTVRPIATAVAKIRSQSSLEPFIIYLLADRVDLSKALTDAMRQNGLLMIGRSEICTTPGFWLEDTMEGLAKAWHAFNDLSGNEANAAFLQHKATVVNRVVEFFLRAELVAHGKDALCGGNTRKGRRLSMGRWFASTPHSGTNINNTFKRDFGKKVLRFCTDHSRTVPVYLNGVQALLRQERTGTTRNAERDDRSPRELRGKRPGRG